MKKRSWSEARLEGAAARGWPDFDKVLLALATLDPAVELSAVAREHGVRASDLLSWRRRLYAGTLDLSDRGSLSGVAEIVVDEDLEELASCAPSPSVGVAFERIEIEAGGVLVRVSAGTSACRIGELAVALRGGL